MQIFYNHATLGLISPNLPLPFEQGVSSQMCVSFVVYAYDQFRIDFTS